MRILIVEDEERVARFIEKGLRENAYTTRWARSCREATDFLSEDSYDMIILDLGLADGDGLDLLHEWRQCRFNEPVVILSARDSIEDRVAGLNLGISAQNTIMTAIQAAEAEAYDYLPKPFSFAELLARIRSQLRRHSSLKQTVLRHRGIKMDLLAHTVEIEDKPVLLTNREYALLEMLMQNQGRVMTRTQIGEKIWDAQYEMQTNLIDVYIRKLRQHLNDVGEEPLIKTVRGVGYMLS